jgi:hypothetical protein
MHASACRQCLGSQAASFDLGRSFPTLCSLIVVIVLVKKALA